MLPSPAWRRQEAVEKEMLGESSREGDCGLLIGRYPTGRTDSVRQRGTHQGLETREITGVAVLVSNLPQILKVTVTNP